LILPILGWGEIPLQCHPEASEASSAKSRNDYQSPSPKTVIPAKSGIQLSK
jgi:hypothetical protein